MCTLKVRFLCSVQPWNRTLLNLFWMWSDDSTIVSDQCTASNARVWRPYPKGTFSRRRRLSWSVFCRLLKRLSNSHTGTGRPGPDNDDDDQLALHYTAVGSSPPFCAWRISVQGNWHSFYNIRFVLKNVIKK